MFRRTPTKAVYGSLYATQTWKRTSEGDPPIIQVAWTRYPDTPNLAWHGMTSFPVQQSLWKFEDGVRLCRNPVDELDNLRAGEQSWRGLTVRSKRPVAEIAPGLLEIQVEFEAAGATKYGLDVGGHLIRYAANEKKLTVDAIGAPLTLERSRLKLWIVVDRPSIDVYADRGQTSVSLGKLRLRPRVHLSRSSPRAARFEFRLCGPIGWSRSGPVSENYERRRIAQSFSSGTAMRQPLAKAFNANVRGSARGARRSTLRNAPQKSGCRSRTPNSLNLRRATELVEVTVDQMNRREYAFRRSPGTNQSDHSRGLYLNYRSYPDRFRR